MEELKNRLRKMVESEGYYLYDVTYELERKDHVLRVMIENDTFIGIDDCVKISKLVSAELDILDPFTDPYMFEVTSGGAERELRNSAEIKRSIGKPVYIEMVDQKFDGILQNFDGDFLTIKHKNKRVTKVDYIDVSFIRLAIMF